MTCQTWFLPTCPFRWLQSTSPRPVPFRSVPLTFLKIDDVPPTTATETLPCDGHISLLWHRHVAPHNLRAPQCAPQRWGPTIGGSHQATTTVNFNGARQIPHFAAQLMFAVPKSEWCYVIIPSPTTLYSIPLYFIPKPFIRQNPRSPLSLSLSRCTDHFLVFISDREGSSSCR